MTLHVLLNVYQEAANLPRCIDSVRTSFMDRVDDISFVFVDGRYPDYPEGPLFSDDGTKELAEMEGAYLPVSDYECEKRTAGLRHIDSVAEPGDWILYLDADEVITQVFAWPKRVGSFTFQRSSRSEISYGRCRLYAWEPRLHFSGRHYQLRDAHGDLVANLEDAPDFQVVGLGVHYDQAHGPLRQELKRDYYRVLRAREELVPA